MVEVLDWSLDWSLDWPLERALRPDPDDGGFVLPVERMVVVKAFRALVCRDAAHLLAAEMAFVRTKVVAEEMMKESMITARDLEELVNCVRW